MGGHSQYCANSYVHFQFLMKCCIIKLIMKWFLMLYIFTIWCWCHFEIQILNSNLLHRFHIIYNAKNDAKQHSSTYIKIHCCTIHSGKTIVNCKHVSRTRTTYISRAGTHANVRTLASVISFMWISGVTFFTLILTGIKHKIPFCQLSKGQKIDLSYLLSIPDQINQAWSYCPCLEDKWNSKIAVAQG